LLGGNSGRRPGPCQARGLRKLLKQSQQRGEQTPFAWEGHFEKRNETKKKKKKKKKKPHHDLLQGYHIATQHRRKKRGTNVKKKEKEPESWGKSKEGDRTVKKRNLTRDGRREGQRRKEKPRKRLEITGVSQKQLDSSQKSERTFARA